MSALRRVAAGVYTEADAHTLEEIQAAKDAGPAALEALMLPVESVFASLPLLTVAPKVEQHLYNAAPPAATPPPTGATASGTRSGSFWALPPSWAECSESKSSLWSETNTKRNKI